MTSVVILELLVKPQVVALGTTMAANFLITKLLHSLESWAMTVSVLFLYLFKTVELSSEKSRQSWSQHQKILYFRGIA